MRHRTEDDEVGGIRFWVWIAAIVVVALAVRVVYLYWLRQQGTFLIGDSYVYHRESQLVADGVGWVSPLYYDGFGIKSELAMHPPGYPFWLAIWSWLGFDSVLAHQIVTIPIGLATVCTCGLIGRQVWAPAAGVVAAGIAALHPSFFSWEGMVIQEPLAMLAGTLVVLAFVRLLRRPDGWSIVLAGLAAGFAPLTRAELGVAVAVAAIVVLIAGWSWRIVRAVVGATVLAMLVVAPWAVHNTMRFDRFVPISNGFGTTLTSTYCNDLLENTVGYWSFPCQARAREEVLAEFRAAHPEATPLAAGQKAVLEVEGYPPFPVDGNTLYAELDDATFDGLLRDHAIEFARENPGYVVRSVPARLGRVLGIYRPIQQIHLDELVDGRQRAVALASWGAYYLLLPLVVAGSVALWRRRRAELVLLATPLIGALAAVTLTFGNTRYRAVGEPSLAVAAAIGIVVIATWVRATWDDRDDGSDAVGGQSTGFDAPGGSAAGDDAAVGAAASDRPPSSISTR